MKARLRWLARNDAALTLLVLGWLAALAWVRPLMLPDEGRYVGVAWEMLRSGDWITPTLNGLPYFHKPPLFYWITAGSMSFFGTNVWAERAAPLLGAWAGALAIYFFVRHWCGRRTALLTLLALVVQPLFFIGAQFANLDMLVAGCIAATVVLLAHSALRIERGESHRRALAAAWLAAALGVLAKGLIGFVLPGLVVGLWLLLRHQWRVLAKLFWSPAMLLFVVVAAPWFIAMQIRFPDFLHYFVVVQHFKRFAQSGFNNVQPFWFYPAVILTLTVFFLPWLRGLVRWAYWRDPRFGAIRGLMAAWLVLIVLFFSLPQSKLIGYILPVVPPLAFLLADGYITLDAQAASGQLARWWGASVVISAAIGVTAMIWLGVFPTRNSRPIGAVLMQRRDGAAQEPIVMLDEYLFDLPLNARLQSPVMVVDDWGSADVRRRDDWRNELADAGRFDRAGASHVLVRPEALAARLCAVPVTWAVGSAGVLQTFPFLTAARLVTVADGFALWEVDSRMPAVRDALSCKQVVQ